MKIFRLFFVFLLAIMASNLSAQNLTMEVLQGHAVGPTTPYFRGDVYLSGGKKVTDMSMTLVYSSVNITIPFEFYASGTRGYAGEEYKDKWWTNNPPNFYLRTGYKDSVLVTFKVGVGGPVETVNRFHPLELYFRFLNTANYKVGDVITINVCNIKVTLEGGQTMNLPDTKLIITITGTSGVETEKKMSGIEKIYPNPAKDFVTIKFLAEQIGTQAKVVDLQGNVLSSYTVFGDDYQLSLNNLPNGEYFIKVGDFIWPLMISR